MNDTYSAWISGRPIYSRLPECYKEGEIADWLTAYWDDILIETKAKVYDLPRQLNPLTCDSNWLDFLAPLCGFTGEYWDKDWDVTAKRKLLDYSYLSIWANKGSKETLDLVLNCFDINHVILSEGDFVLGASKIGQQPLGTTPWEYTIYLPSSYLGLYKADLTRKLNRLFGPCWCESQIIFDNQYFN